MAQVVQAACPGCRAILRIPSEWLHQPIRCKGCGTVVQALAPAPQSPVPPTRPAPPPPPRQASRPAPPPPPTLPPANGVHLPAPMASTAVAPPLAAPLGAA